MPKIITIIIQNPPYQKDNKAWHALRLAGAALAEDMRVRVHLLDDGVKLGKRNQDVPDGLVNLEELLAELILCDLEVQACGMALDGCNIKKEELLEGICVGSMKALAHWINESDTVLTF